MQHPVPSRLAALRLAAHAGVDPRTATAALRDGPDAVRVGVLATAVRKMSARNLRPRATAAVPVQPLTVSDRTAPALVGLEPRAFRDLLEREHVPHARIGRRVVARVAFVLEAIDRLSLEVDATTETASAADDEADDEPTADEILARLGRRRSA